MRSDLIYSLCDTISVGCKVYTDRLGKRLATAGKYSDGTNCFTVNNLGVVTASEVCGGITTTSTTTSTTTTSTTTTSTTTLSPDCTCYEIVVTSEGGEESNAASIQYLPCDGGTNVNRVFATSGTYYQCARVVGGLAQIEFNDGTGTITPVGSCNTGTCPPTTTTTTIAETVYYVLERCDDANTFYSIGYPSGTFANRERVTAIAGGIIYTFIVVNVLSFNPGGGLLTLTGTGQSECPITETATLNWSFTEANGAQGEYNLLINDVIVETRFSSTSGTYTVNDGDSISVTLSMNQCTTGGNTYSNAYTLGIINEASCVNNGPTSLVTFPYYVSSADIGTTITLSAFVSCDSGCA